MKRVAWGLFGAACALSLHAPAAADSMPDPDKEVTCSIVIEGTVAAGSSLVVAESDRVASILDIGRPHVISRVSGDAPLRIVLVESAAVAGKSGTALASVAATGLACGTAFRPVRTMRGGSATDEVRYVYRVEASAVACAATFVRTDYLKAGQPVLRAQGAKVPARASTSTPPTAPSAAASDPAKPGGGCAVGAGEGLAKGAALTLALAAAVAAYRRASARSRARREPQL